MRLTHSLDTRQQQSQRIDPRQILASEILAWTSAELEAAVERELSDNPALEINESAIVWEQNSLSGGDVVAAHRPEASPLLDSATHHDPIMERSPSIHQPLPAETWDEDPMERIAQSRSLRDYLRDQVGQIGDETLCDVTRYLIDWVDERGYLTVSLADVAEKYCISPSRVEEAVKALHGMEPCGVGARDVRECLRLQVDYLTEIGEAHPLAKRVVYSCWDDLVAHRDERIATRLRADIGEVRAALSYLRHALTPYPGATFRPSTAGKNGATEGNASVRPDIVYHRTEGGFTVEITRDFEDALTIAPMWSKLAERGDTHTDESLRRYIREHVDRAQTFMNGLSRRGRTLRLIAHTLAHVQQGFLETANRAFLRPLTRQMLAGDLELDESVISRAVADKWAQLPGGEMIPLDAFFGNAHAVREALVALIAKENPHEPLSDDEIAEHLTVQGFPLARRTVAKYRSLEKILPARLRKREEDGCGASAVCLAA
ncbi:MAG: hypothetical protein H7Y38_18110 [Armatimonadetes bacterium]|nr:hypothetical protein [Armatimonadota bacterium]